MATISTEHVARLFVEVTDVLVDDFDLIEFLQMVTARTAEVVDAAAAGLLLTDGQDRLQFMAASDEETRLLELFQLQHQEGPCLDAFHTGQPVLNADLRDAADRWPTFAPRAAGAGFRGVHAFPLRHHRTTIGALNLFSLDTGPFEPTDVKLVQALADVATIGLLQERTIRRAEVLTEQLQAALNSRIVIEQAKGALSRVHSVGVDDAFQLMRSYARRTGRRLGQVALAVLEEPASVRELMPVRSGGPRPVVPGDEEPRPQG